MTYGYYPYEYYYNPCNECKDKNCHSCKITKLEEEMSDTKEQLSSAEFKIRTELEPRINREKRSYDNWVSSGES